jgi:peptidoglycan/xylan/chitin deacetylase (PgdA/CDA1 family)
VSVHLPARQLAWPIHPVPILTYHNIGDPPIYASHRGLHLRLSKFRSHLDTLHRYGYAGVSMDDGLRYLRGAATDRAAIITFDDGYLDNFELALPVLREHGFTATCYVVADQIGHFNARDRDDVRVTKPLMNFAAIKGWLEAGMKVGSHTLSHPRLSTLERSAKRREIVESKQALEDRLGIPIHHFCFPYGDHDRESLELVREAGYITAVTTRRGRVRASENLHALPRIGNSGKRSPFIFKARTFLWNLEGIERRP